MLGDCNRATDLAEENEFDNELARLATLLLKAPEQAKRQLWIWNERLRAQGSVHNLARVTLMISHCDFYQGHYRETREVALNALELARRVYDSVLEVRALNTIGVVGHRLGTPDEAMQYLLESLRLALRNGNQDGAARALENIGTIYNDLGDYQEALALHERGLEIAHNSGFIPSQANLLVGLLEDHYNLRQYDQALAIADEAVALSFRHGLSRFEGRARSEYARVLLALGRTDAGLRMVRSGLKVARLAHDAELESRLHWVEGLALLQLGDLNLAAVRLHTSREINAKMGYKLGEVDTHLALAQLYTQCGDPEQAAFHQREAQGLRQAMLGEKVTQRIQAIRSQLQQQLRRQTEEASHPWSADLARLTHSLRQAKVELNQTQTYDLLTEAMSRSYLLQKLELRLMICGPEDLLGVVFVSIDHMRTLNELFGQTGGDQLLVTVANRLLQATRPGDLVGRLGGDEFVVVLSHLAHPSDLDLVMEHCWRAIGQPYTLRGEQVSITASLGGVLAPKDGTTAETLFKRADLTVRQVKASGRNATLTFQSELGEVEAQRRTLEYNLRSALNRQELRLHYQAIYAISDQRVVAYEALIRWQHPRFGLLGPQQFIGIAEENRSILDIGRWVLNEACAQAKAWHVEENGVKVGLNISPLQFGEASFVDDVRAALTHHGLKGSALILEITESVAHQDHGLTARHIAALHELGVDIALDDFGTGFSSLSLLSEMSFDILKIDRSLLRPLDLTAPVGQEPPVDRRTRILLEATIRLARQLGMRVIAEGIEEEEHFNILRDMECDEVQGYWLARPAPPEQVPPPVNAPL